MLSKLFDWNLHKKWYIAAGLFIIPAAAYIGWRLFMVNQKSKKGQFDRKMKNLKYLILTKGGKRDNIFPLHKIKTEKMTDDSCDLVFEAHLVGNYKKKQKIGNNSSTFSKEDPFLPPYEPGMYITEIGEHRLLYNKFPVIKNHVLVVSKAYEEQSTPLSRKDFHTTYQVLKCLKGVAIYNSGWDSGASQSHRHLQIIPQSRDFSQPMKLQIDKEAIESVKEGLKYFRFSGYFKFKHYVVNLEPFNPEEQELKQYAEVLVQAYKKLLKLLNNEDVAKSYSFVWTENWMFMILRDKAKAFGKFCINSVGFTGSFIAKNIEDLNELTSHGPLDVLRQICTPCILEQVD